MSSCSPGVEARPLGDDVEALGVVESDGCPCLGAMLSDELRYRICVVPDLADMGHQRLDLAVDRVRDIDDVLPQAGTHDPELP